MNKKKKFTIFAFYTISTLIVIVWLIPFVIAAFTSVKFNARPRSQRERSRNCGEHCR